ncbi:MAG: homocysteine S-methyltransferase family protein [Gemmatimonadota bacterium]|nr:MAG: homocysteine S-methyltransferase family protein [Gemmatimonadota bacterium]
MLETSEFLKRIETSVLLFDGAMGTQIQIRGLPRGTCLEEWNVSHPEVIKEIHRAYYEAGSDVVLTNSFGGNKYLLGKYGYGDKVQAFNVAAAQLAGEVRPEGRYVAGSVGPTGEFIEPLGERTYEELWDCFRQQIVALVDGGIDLICIETMSDLDETKAAIEAATSVTDLPVCATMAFDLGKRGFRTMMGVSPQEAARTLNESGAHVIGCNCGSITIEEMALLVKEFRLASSLPILAQANAGVPRLIEGETVHPQGAEDYAEGVIPLLEAGANLIGGCCGTTPEHIKLTTQKIQNHLTQQN